MLGVHCRRGEEGCVRGAERVREINLSLGRRAIWAVAIWVGGALVGIWPGGRLDCEGTVAADDPTGRSVSRDSDIAKPPSLSIDSLYHPSKKFDHVTGLAPLHWIGAADPSDRPWLVTKRDDRWVRWDLDRGEVIPWPLADRLREKIDALVPPPPVEDAAEPSESDDTRPVGRETPGDSPRGDRDSQSAPPSGAKVRSAQINRYVDQVIGRLDRSGPGVLIRIDRKLVWFRSEDGRSVQSRVIASDASDWNDPTLDPTGQTIAYTRQGDLYLYEIAKERTIRVTGDGSDTLLNGRLDWTYQEEIYGRGKFKGFWFSPDGRHLAMLRIDIQSVPPYTLSQTSQPRGEGPIVRYPKAGDPIPHASLRVFGIEGGRVSRPIELTRSTPDDERIISGVWWDEAAGSLLYCTSDRLQTQRVLYRFDFQAGGPRGEWGGAATEVVLREESPAWVEPPSRPIFLSRGDFLWRTQLATGRARLLHIADGGRVIMPVTPESTHVRSAWQNQVSGEIYYTADAPDGLGTENHVYRIGLPMGSQGPRDGPMRDGPMRDGGRRDGVFRDGTIRDPVTGQPERLTHASGWHQPMPSPRGQWWVDSFSTVDRPPVRTLHSGQETDETASFEGRLPSEGMPIDAAPLKLVRPLRSTASIRFTTRDGLSLPALLLPPDAIPGRQRLPVLIEVYGGPQSPSTLNRWRGNRRLFREWLARRGIGVMVIDNRSSIDAGVAGSWPIRGHFGKVELADTLAAVSDLKSRSWVDPDAIGLSGWSFGGFLTTYAMTRSDAFAMGIAGGSVTEWTEYDAFYTERYMGLPKINDDGYEASSVVAKAGDLHGDLLLIHGEVDDNVHPSGTLRLAAALQQNGQLFDLMLYPSAAHAVHSPGQVYHLMKTMDRFLDEHLLER